jgi:HSP20 family protein
MYKNSKIFIVSAIVLAVILIFETAYLLGMNYEKHKYKKMYHAVGLYPVSRGNGFRLFFSSPSEYQGVNKTLSNPTEQWEPLGEMERIQYQMNRIFRESFEKARSTTAVDQTAVKRFFEPDMDIQESSKKYIVRADLPGLAKKDIAVEIKGNVLSISGERTIKEVEENTHSGFVQKERSFGYFSRSVLLPESVNHEGIKTNYENGVLTITIPKLILNTEKGQQNGKIAVQ